MGAKIKAYVSLIDGSTIYKVAIENVAVLPVPDYAYAIVSIPFNKGRIPFC